MTHKDYVLIARALCESSTLQAMPDADYGAIAADNPRFDRGRFLFACGVEA